LVFLKRGSGKQPRIEKKGRACAGKKREERWGGRKFPFWGPWRKKTVGLGCDGPGGGWGGDWAGRVGFRGSERFSGILPRKNKKTRSNGKKGKIKGPGFPNRGDGGGRVGKKRVNLKKFGKAPVTVWVRGPSAHGRKPFTEEPQTLFFPGIRLQGSRGFARMDLVRGDWVVCDRATHRPSMGNLGPVMGGGIKKSGRRGIFLPICRGGGHPKGRFRTHGGEVSTRFAGAFPRARKKGRSVRPPELGEPRWLGSPVSFTGETVCANGVFYGEKNRGRLPPFFRGDEKKKKGLTLVRPYDVPEKEKTGKGSNFSSGFGAAGAREGIFSDSRGVFSTFPGRARRARFGNLRRGGHVSGASTFERWGLLGKWAGLAHGGFGSGPNPKKPLLGPLEWTSKKTRGGGGPGFASFIQHAGPTGGGEWGPGWVRGGSDSVFFPPGEKGPRGGGPSTYFFYEGKGRFFFFGRFLAGKNLGDLFAGLLAGPGGTGRGGDG